MSRRLIVSARIMTTNLCVMRPVDRLRSFTCPARSLDAIDERRSSTCSLDDGRRSASEIGRQRQPLPRGRQATDRPARGARRHPRIHARSSTTRSSAASIEAFSELRFAAGTQVDDIDRAVADLPELVEAFTIAGDPDALIRVRVTDVDHLKQVINQVRRGTPGGAEIINTKTLIVLGRTTGPAGAGI